MKKNIPVLLILSLLTIGIAYQNCADIHLQAPQNDSVLKVGAYQAKFCLRPIEGIQYSLVSAMVINLNAIPNQGSFLADSDVDGLADVDETGAYSATNSRSRGYLDSICANSGTCPATPACTNSGAYFQLGITSCDLQAFTSIEVPANVFDSNFNGIPDFIEVIRKSDPFSMHYGLSDPDQDNYSINQEILNATDPRFSDAQLATAHQTKIRKVSNDVTCPLPFENYEIGNTNLPYVPVLAFTDPNTFTSESGAQLNLSHDENQNIIYTSIILRSREGVSPVRYRGFLHLDSVESSSYPGTTSDISIETGDFISVGGWEQ